MGDGRPVGYAREGALHAMGGHWAPRLHMRYGIRRGVRRKPTCAEKRKTQLGSGRDGSFYRARCFRVSDLQNVWNTGDKTEDRHALSDAKESVGTWATRRNMDSLRVERLLRHLGDTHQSNGKKLVINFDNETCHSRRSDHRVSHIGVAEGRLAKGGGLGD